jgi:hypothetical protein
LAQVFYSCDPIYTLNSHLRPRSLFLSEEECVQGNVGHLDNLEPDAGNITDGVTLPTESSDQDLVVFLDKVETTVLGNEGCDLLAVLDELNTNALSDGRVGLFGLNTDLELEIGLVLNRPLGHANQFLTFSSTMPLA